MESWEQDSLKVQARLKPGCGALFNGILGAGFVERLNLSTINGSIGV